LKTIDISSAGTLQRMSHDSEKIVAGGSEDGEVFWFALDFAKQVSNTSRCTVQHRAPVSCVKYFKSTPLMCTADSEGCVIFWSMQPLRSFEFFTKLEVDWVKRKPTAEGSPASTTSQQCAAAEVAGITSLAISNFEEEILVVGSEHGHLVGISIKDIVQKARTQRDDILMRKEHGEAADVISGRIFEKMEKPYDSPEYVFTPENAWLVERAHRGSVDQIIFCKNSGKKKILTLGFDVRVCMWDPFTGEALGTLEQGLGEGLQYERCSKWSFPIDAHNQVKNDVKMLADAALSEVGSQDEDENKDSFPRSDDGQAVGADPTEKEDDAPSAGPKEGSRAGSENGSQSGALRKPLQLTRSASSPGMIKNGPHKLNGIEYPDYSKTASRLLKPKVAKDHEWFAGPLGTSQTHLPSLNLSSGLARTPNVKAQAAVVMAAKNLSRVLNSVDGKKGGYDAW